jgi:hypothetical protein
MHNGLAVNAFGEREQLDLMTYPQAATVVGVILKVAVLPSYAEGPVAGFAVLRYRLYDIDRFVNYSRLRLSHRLAGSSVLPGSSTFTTPAFRFRAVLNGDGSEEVELARA